jgi:hypothetical protein
MDNRIEAAAIIASALLRDHSDPTPEKIAELLEKAMEAVDLAVAADNRRVAKRNAELKMNLMTRR